MRRARGVGRDVRARDGTVALLASWRWQRAHSEMGHRVLSACPCPCPCRIVRFSLRAHKRAGVRTSVPNLGLDGFAVDLDRACRKLDADGRLGLEVELVPCEPRQQVGLADARVADQDDCCSTRRADTQRATALSIQRERTPAGQGPAHVAASSAQQQRSTQHAHVAASPPQTSLHCCVARPPARSAGAPTYP